MSVCLAANVPSSNYMCCVATNKGAQDVAKCPIFPGNNFIFSECRINVCFGIKWFDVPSPISQFLRRLRTNMSGFWHNAHAGFNAPASLNFSRRPHWYLFGPILDAAKHTPQKKLHTSSTSQSQLLVMTDVCFTSERNLGRFRRSSYH